MDDSEREEYLKEVRRKGSTIGARLPETITVGGDELELGEFLIETRKLDAVPPDAKTKITEATRALRAERERRLDRLETEPISHDTAEEIVTAINGIDRALNALENIRHPEYGEQSRNETVEDYKRWVGFVDKINR